MSIIYKNVIEKFVTITLFLKESMLLLRGQSVILYNKIVKINTYIYTNIFFNKKWSSLAPSFACFGPFQIFFLFPLLPMKN